MKILVSSTQIFDKHTDNVSEEYNGKVIFLENGFKIEYNNSLITLLNDVLIVNTESISMKIEKNKKNFSEINTPYGKINLEVVGENLKWNKEPFVLEVRYKLRIGKTEEYINELRIQISKED